jgi:hypothetical protein
MIFILACSRSGSAITAHDKESLATVKALVYLQPIAKQDVPRELLQSLDQQIRSELHNRGYVFLDPVIATQYCPNVTCTKLPASYPIDAIARFTLNKLNHINAIIGHYSEMAGTLTFYKPDGSKLFAIKEALKERGGLVFNLGQIFKGIVATIKNNAQDRYNLLAEKLARNIALNLPQNNKEQALLSEQLIPKVNKVTATKEKATAFYKPSPYTSAMLNDRKFATRICLYGTSDNLAYLVIRGESGLRSEIRMPEIQKGIYCRTVASEIIKQAEKAQKNSDSGVYVELKTPFGNSIRRNVL